MTSITIALAITTLVFFLFPATRLFSAMGTLILAYLFPTTFASIAAVAIGGFAFYHWSLGSRH